MKRIGLMGLVLLISLNTFAQKNSLMIKLKTRLDSLFETENQSDRFHGTVVIGNKENILYQKAIGIANRSWGTPMEMEGRFDIASINKSYFAALVLIAIEEGRLSLDDKLVDLLQKYDYQGSFSSEITVHQMLSHTSGLPDYDAVPPEIAGPRFIKFKRKHFNNAEYVDFISQLKIVGKPGKQFYYSNFAYHMLGIILEDTYQQHFSEILEEKICKPFQIKNTYAAKVREEVHPKLVEAYSYHSDTQKWQSNDYIDLSLGRRIFASSLDLYQWGLIMCDNSLLSKTSLKLMQTNHVKAINPNISYGYGWVVFDGQKEYDMGNLSIDKKYIIHGGATQGYKSMLIIIEQGEFIITFLSNVGDRTNEIQLAQKITHILY